MPNSIGMRVYLISLHKKGEVKQASFDSRSLINSPPDFISTFIDKHTNSIEDAAAERSWYFEKKLSKKGSEKGYIHYGTFGFESKFKDTKTRKVQYHRKRNDVEEIPLFYEFWHPANSNFIFILFQSFQGRSCINLIVTRIKESFEKENQTYQLIIKKLVPSDARGTGYYNSEVKKLTFIKRKASGDIADRYLADDAPETFNVELSITARRNSSLGKFGGLFSSLTQDVSGLLVYEGTEFDEAIAEVKIGGRSRRVGVFGNNSNAGVIDVSENIVRGADGHPTFESLVRESDVLLNDFYKTVSGKQ